MRAVGAARLIAERRAAVAVARRRVAARVALQMQPAGRHGEVGAQAQLLAVGIGEHVGARAQRLADHVEEQPGRLDHGRRDALVAGARERRHQALRLRVQGFDVRGWCGGMAASSSPPRSLSPSAGRRRHGLGDAGEGAIAGRPMSGLVALAIPTYRLTMQVGLAPTVRHPLAPAAIADRGQARG